MESFRLLKSYRDVVDAAGRCAIAYSSELRWGPLSVNWHALSVHEPGQPAVHRSVWGRSADALGYRARSLRSLCPPFAARLLDTGAGAVDWSCDAPAESASFEFDDRAAIDGSGYAEHLVLDVLPWRLPIDELRWGRWISQGSGRSLTWVDWQGPKPFTLVLDGGVPRDGVVGEASIRCGPRALTLESPVTLYSRTLEEALGRARPILERLPVAWRRLEDRKTLSRGVMDADTGWAIHETVRFP